MLKILFQQENLLVEVEEGLTFVALEENYITPLLFGCLEGNCGTCKIDKF